MMNEKDFGPIFRYSIKLKILHREKKYEKQNNIKLLKEFYL